MSYFCIEQPDAKTGGKGTQLPEGFPRELLPLIGVDGSVKMSDTYRKYDCDNDTDSAAEKQFVWFVENIVSKINPRKTEYPSRCAHHEISNIFHETDEAWGLMILLNEYEVWEWEAAKRMSDNKVLYCEANKKPKTRFTSRENTNSKRQFSGRDIEMFQDICRLVRLRRSDDVSKEWEKKFMARKHRDKIAAAGRGMGTAAGGCGVLSEGEGGIGNDENGPDDAGSAEGLARKEARQMAFDDFASCLDLSKETVANMNCAEI